LFDEKTTFDETNNSDEINYQNNNFFQDINPIKESLDAISKYQKQILEFQKQISLIGEKEKNTKCDYVTLRLNKNIKYLDKYIKLIKTLV
jgi:hypothetical protein